MASYPKPKNNISESELPLDTPLWCVYGAKSFPSIIVCKILKDPKYGLIIWGYSIYKRQPGFRTLGQRLSDWLASEYHENAFFFEKQVDAIAYINELVTPKCD